MEGAEFLDLRGTDHSQNNFVRGACRLGVMPCNGMLYVPPDQCFCQPGAKLLGFAASRRSRSRRGEVSKSRKVGKPEEKSQTGERLERGAAYAERPRRAVAGQR